VGDQRERILDAAATLFETSGIVHTSRRDIAQEAEVSTRSVTAIGRHRSDLLALVVESLPFPPTSQRLRDQAEQADAEPLAAILAVARDAFGAPASVWDTREIQAVALAPFDDRLAEVVRERIGLRWNAAATVIDQLRGSGAVDERIDDDAATLHLLAVGAGLALLGPMMSRNTDPGSWLSLVARLLEALAADDPPGWHHAGHRRPWRIRIETSGTPGATAQVMRVLALLRADVTTMFAHALGPTTPDASTDADHPPERRQLLDLIVSVPDTIERSGLEQALASVSQRVLIAPGKTEDSADVVTRVLDGATGLAENPDAAPQAAADLVLADSWQVLPASTGPDSSADVMRLQWTPDLHVVLTRPGSPFVAVERLRASALLRLVDALASAPAGEGGFGWRESTRLGRPVTIRLARPWDAESVAEMHARCSEETRFERYFAPVSDWREDQLRRIAGGHRGATLVAIADDGRIVGLGNVFPDRPESTGTAEIAVIVEDDWQGQGLGRSLLDHLIELAGRLGFEAVTALVLATNSTMLSLLESRGLSWERSADPDMGSRVVRLTAALPN
jgi:GNAT superfamily N-acetyltransferase/AcrR family transcriptional regulator